MVRKTSFLTAYGSEREAAETQVWLDYALECKYLNPHEHAGLNDKYDHIISMLVNMCNKPENWSC